MRLVVGILLPLLRVPLFDFHALIPIPYHSTPFCRDLWRDSQVEEYKGLTMLGTHEDTLSKPLLE